MVGPQPGNLLGAIDRLDGGLLVVVAAARDGTESGLLNPPVSQFGSRTVVLFAGPGSSPPELTEPKTPPAATGAVVWVNEPSGFAEAWAKHTASPTGIATTTDPGYRGQPGHHNRPRYRGRTTVTPSPAPARGNSALWTVTLEAVGPILTLALAFGLIRVFEGDRWVIPVLIAALSSHLLALSARRIGWGVPVSALVGGVGLILVITWTHYRDTTFWGLPARSTWSALINDQDQAWAALGNLSPPVEPLNGFIVSAMAAVWALAFFNDWAAMRTRTLLESLLLPIAVTGLVGLIGDERHRMLTIGVFIAALLLFVWIHRVVARTTGAAWLGGESRAPDGRRAMLLAGALPAAIALAAAVLVGPVLGDHDDPLLDLTGIADRDDSGTERFVISPLVDIRGRLVNQAETVMFRVRADQRSYWRLTSLDRFDGQVWTSRADYAESPSRLPSQFPSGTSVEQSSQEYHIEQLAAVWLPAAFEPRYLDSDITDISYEPSSSTLIVGRSLANSDNLTYTVVSAVPRFDPEALRAIPSSAPTSPDLARYTRLPSDFSPRIRELAAEIGGGTGSDYEQALALPELFSRWELHLRHQHRRGPFREPHRKFPGDPARLLRAVCRNFRRHGPIIGSAGPGGGGLHRGRVRSLRSRPVPGAGPARPRLARGLFERGRMGGIRAHTGPGGPRGSELHRSGREPAHRRHRDPTVRGRPAPRPGPRLRHTHRFREPHRLRAGGLR